MVVALTFCKMVEAMRVLVALLAARVEHAVEAVQQSRVFLCVRLGGLALCVSEAAALDGASATLECVPVRRDNSVVCVSNATKLLIWRDGRHER